MSQKNTRCDSIIIALFMTMMMVPWTIVGASCTDEPECSWMRTARNESVDAQERIEALDSLVIRFDPLYFEFFKDIAFRSQDSKVALVALDYLSSFAQTYRWSEACDTLTAVMSSHPDETFQAAALQTNKIAYYALLYGACFDRNRMVDVLVKMIAPGTHIRDAGSFYGAVWLLANVADNTQIHAINALAYVRDHYNDYELTDAITATDALQIFKSNINQEYFDLIDGFDPPPLIDTLPAGASTNGYITAVGCMLDSTATDSIGFLALQWLKENGNEENGDEGIRLRYLASVAAAKRPDIAAEVRNSLQEILPRFGLSVKRPFVNRLPARSPFSGATVTADGMVLIEQLSPGDHIRIVTLQGRVYYSEVVSGRSVKVTLRRPLSASGCIIVRNGHPLPLRIRR